MGAIIVRRLGHAAVILLLVSVGTFGLIHAAPGGPGILMDPNLRPEDRERLAESLGLNDPLPVQYLKWLRNAIILDFGRSYQYQRPVGDVIAERAWPTFQLGVLSYAVGLIGVPLGIHAARNRGRLGDNLVRFLTVVGTSVPTWWLALSIIVLLNSLIGWFPNGQGSGSVWDWFRHIILPATLLGLGGLITFTRFVRSEVLEVLGQDYVRTARAKGLGERAINRYHVFRNALIPVVTILGYVLPAVLSGAIITEYIFNWPGMGRLFFEAASSRDYPLLLAMLTLGTVLTILGTLMADIGYGVVDPRIRYE